MNCLQKICLYSAFLALPTLALAQQKTPPDPVNPKASVPEVIYVSPFREHRSLGDEPLASWKTSNDVVEKAGGWKAYAKEAQEPKLGSDKAVTPPASASKPAAHDGHAGQKNN